MVDIHIVNLNNKSRKGLYIYVKHKGKPTRYYRFTGGQAQIDATVKYYEDRYLKKGSTKSSYYQYRRAYQEKVTGVKSVKRGRVQRQAEQYLAQVRKRGGIQKQFTKGVGSGVVEDILNASKKDIQRAKEDTISSLVLDKKLLGLLTNDQNFNKLKNRLDYKITAVDSSGNTLIEASVHGKDVQDVQNTVKRAFFGNSYVSKQKYRMLIRS